jgi:hypothetical protein
MGPSNDNELEIAREMDWMSQRQELNPNTVSETLAFLAFKMSSKDYEFLRRYVHWRLENPIAK